MHLPEMDVIQFSPRTWGNAEKYARARSPSTSDRAGIHRFFSTSLQKTGGAQQSRHPLFYSLIVEIHLPRLYDSCQAHWVGSGLYRCPISSAIIAASTKSSDPITEISLRKVEPEDRSQYHTFAHVITESHNSGSGQDSVPPFKRGKGLHIDLCLNSKQHSEPGADSMFGDIVDFTTHKIATQRE